jgi:hypothetical protein
MATEGPMYQDGAQCQAAANYWNPATTLYGPFGSGQFLAVYISAPRVVTLADTTARVVYGFLQNTPDIGQAADVTFEPSVTKAVAGAAVTAGSLLMVDAAHPGCVITWVGASTNFSVGLAIESAAGLSTVFTIKQFPSITRV